jgi:hypothetical protein
MRRYVAAVSVMLALVIAIVSAQTTQLSGTVRDKSAGVLPGVTVTVSGPALDKDQTTTTDARGKFTFKSLPPDDTYVVTFSLAGFNSIVQKKVAVASDKVATTDAVMTVADVPTEPPIRIPNRFGIVPLSTR